MAKLFGIRVQMNEPFLCLGLILECCRSRVPPAVVLGVGRGEPENAVLLRTALHAVLRKKESIMSVVCDMPGCCVQYIYCR